MKNLTSAFQNMPVYLKWKFFRLCYEHFWIYANKKVYFFKGNLWSFKINFEHKAVPLSVHFRKMYLKWTFRHEYWRCMYLHVYCEHKMLPLKIYYCEKWRLVTADVWNVDWCKSNYTIIWFNCFCEINYKIEMFKK